MTIFKKFLAAMTTRSPLLDQSRKLQAEFASLPPFVRYALRRQSELPEDVIKSLSDWQRSTHPKT